MGVGILGGGQLGRMLALAGTALDLRFVFVDPTPGGPASQVAPQIVAELGIPTAPFATVNDSRELRQAVRELGLPCLLKTRRFGYDGNGQRVLRCEADVAGAFEALHLAPCILEGFVPFEREVSLIAVRALNGTVAFHPLVENFHQEGILRLTLEPAPQLTSELQAKAEGKARKLLEHLDYVGVVTIEFFCVAGRLIANEFAPRVHNSGHWSIEGAVTSQFENHLRAITGLPLGATQVRGAVAKRPDCQNCPNAR